VPKPIEIYENPGAYWHLITTAQDIDFEDQHFDRKEAGRPDPAGHFPEEILKRFWRDYIWEPDLGDWKQLHKHVATVEFSNEHFQLLTEKLAERIGKHKSLTEVITEVANAPQNLTEEQADGLGRLKRRAMAATWQEYQEEVAEFFRSVGAETKVNHVIQGVRTTHAIDVFVKLHYVGFDVVWIVECKHWNSKVTKLHVLALREIVSDIGADRGIFLCEAGFQSGAVEAATLTNVHVKSLADLRGTASADINAMRLRELFDRTEICRQRYWDIPKSKRIECGLRPDVPEGGYSGDHVIELANQLLSKAIRGNYPFDIDSLPAVASVQALIMFGGPRQFNSASEIISTVEPMIVELEGKLSACVAKIQSS